MPLLYPIGARINGETLTEAAIHPAKAFSLGGISYPKGWLAHNEAGETEAAWLARLNAIGVCPVEYADAPDYDPYTQALPEPTLAIEEGWCMVSWGDPVDRTDIDLTALGDIRRATRDRLLTACDWTQLPDSPLDETAKAAWATYRQALRDVPAQDGFPLTVNWPEAPEA